MSADCVEALIGALYEHRGAAAVRQFIDSRIWSRFKDIEGSLVWSNPKTYLQRLMSKAGRGVPEYRLVAETGRFTHAPVFKVAVVVDDKQLGTATGRSIRDAESNAAVNVLREHFSTMNPHPELRSTHDLAAPLS